MSPEQAARRRLALDRIEEELHRYLPEEATAHGAAAAFLPAWTSALYLLASLRDKRVWPYVQIVWEESPAGLRRRGIDFDRMLTDIGWSSTERIVIEVAWSLYDGQKVVDLAGVAEWLGEGLWADVITALYLRRGGAA